MLKQRTSQYDDADISQREPHHTGLACETMTHCWLAVSCASSPSPPVSTAPAPSVAGRAVMLHWWCKLNAKSCIIDGAQHVALPSLCLLVSDSGFLPVLASFDPLSNIFVQLEDTCMTAPTSSIDGSHFPFHTRRPYLWCFCGNVGWEDAALVDAGWLGQSSDAVRCKTLMHDRGHVSQGENCGPTAVKDLLVWGSGGLGVMWPSTRQHTHFTCDSGQFSNECEFTSEKRRREPTAAVTVKNMWT